LGAFLQTQHKIRTASPSDFPALIQLFQEFAEFEKQSEKMQNTVERMTSEQNHFHGFVAENQSGDIIGYVTWFLCYFTWTGKAMYMDDLYVRPSFRGQGAGTALMQQVIARAREENCHKVRWQVSSWNIKAQELYKSVGATIDGGEWNCDLLLK